MAKESTPQEVQDDYLRVLGPELGPLHYALVEEVTWLHSKWGQFRILFAESPERIDLLNGTAGFFFRVIQDTLWENVLLHIARLTDPKQSLGKHDNLTLLRLPDAIKDAALSTEIAALVQRAKQSSEFVKDWRNRYLAHRDLSLAINTGAEPLAAASREKVELALKDIRAILNRIEGAFCQNEIGFTHVITRGNAEDLCYHLKVAADAEARELDDLLNGKLPSGS